MSLYSTRARKSAVTTVVCAVLMTTSVLLLPAGSSGSEDDSTLRVGILDDIGDFNTFNLGTNTQWKHQVLDWAYEGIFGIDHDSTPYLLLAGSCTIVEVDDFVSEVYVNLREGVTFHDGHEMTADDVYFTYLMLRSGTTYSSPIIEAFDTDYNYDVTEAELTAGVQVLGTYTVGFFPARPCGQLLSQTLTVPIMPKHIWEDHVDSENRVDVTWGNDPDATIGTGPFMYAGGVALDHRVMEKAPSYWGTEFLTPEGFATYPPNVDRLHFDVKPSIDSAIYALMSGEIDHIASPVPHDKLTLLDSAPTVAVDYLDDSGYFYLGFNMKREPFGSLAFRKAVSHLIDKEHIVDELMGGLGVAGTTPVSPCFGEWHNELVDDYVYDDPEDPVTTIPEDLLDGAGFDAFDSDGWRVMPDGSSMDEIVILAPPADYDPIRARAAEMIAADLVEVGLRAKALPVDFSTLVGKMMSFDYGMLVLGFNFAGYSEGVSILFDVFGPASPSNSWAFWSEANPNPFFSDLGGVSTLADAETQALVDEFASIEAAAKSTPSVGMQIFLVRQGQEILADAVPVNVLYYRVNAMATSTGWTGWTPYMGSLLNMFSLSELSGGGVDRVYEDASEDINAGLSSPRTLVVGDTVSGHVQVIDGAGIPVPDVDVSVALEPITLDGAEAAVSPSSGETDADGMFYFELTGVSDGAGVLRTIAEHGSSTAEDSVLVSVSPVLPSTLILSAEVEKAVVVPGEVVEIEMTVLDEHELPVVGAEVSVDAQLLCHGQVTPATAVTDSSGQATVFYTAPLAFPESGGHLLEKVLMTVAKDGYTHAGSAYLEMLVYDGSPPDWALVRITSVTSTSLSSSTPVATVMVAAVDDDGVALPSEPLAIAYSDESYLSCPVMTATTDLSGFASFDVEVVEGAPTGAFRVTVSADAVPGAVPASVTFTYVGSTAPTEEMYGGYITFDEAAQFMPVLGTLHATAHVWDSSGVAAEGKAAFVLPVPMEGTLVSSPEAEYDSQYDYTGIEVTTHADGMCQLATGPFSVPDLVIGWDPYYSYTMEGVDMVAGEVDITLEGVGASMVDFLGEIIVIPEGSGEIDWVTWIYTIEGSTSIVGGYAYSRSYQVLSTTHEVEWPMLLATMAPYCDTTTVTVTVTDQDGYLVEGADVQIYQPFVGRSMEYGVLEYSDPWGWGTVPTDSDGIAELTVVAARDGYELTDALVSADIRSVAEVPGMAAISLPSQSSVFINPQKATIECEPVVNPVLIGTPAVVEALVTNVTDDLPIPDSHIEMFAGADDTITDSAATDADGRVSFAIDTSGITGSEGGFIPTTLWTSSGGYAYCSVRVMVPFTNPRPEITIAEPGEGAVLYSSTVTISGTVTDANGVASVTLAVDGGAPIVLPIAMGDVSVSFEYTVHNLVDGPHAIVVEASDMLMVSSSEVRTFTVAATQFVLVRLDGPASGSAIETSLSPENDCLWSATFENSGLRGVSVTLYEVVDDELAKIVRFKIGFYGDTGGVFETPPVDLLAGHEYIMEFVPLGPAGGSAVVSISLETLLATASPLDGLSV